MTRISGANTSKISTGSSVMRRKNCPASCLTGLRASQAHVSLKHILNSRIVC
jgi:hypothetical protein